jgi:sulfur carrier protein
LIAHIKYSHTYMINISLNNEPQEIEHNITLSDALVLWGFEGVKIAVAINGEFVPRSTYGERRLEADDLIDIVKPVGGG